MLIQLLFRTYPSVLNTKGRDSTNTEVSSFNGVRIPL